jgi:mRNA-degrading endonuclease toxin of MazEF toxin-antitoxin module
VTQYELWWADLAEPMGRRPVLLLTRPAGYAYLNRVLACEVTTRIRRIPQEVPLGRAEGLARASVARLDNVHVVPKDCLSRRIGALAPGRIRELKRALGYALDWPELIHDA